MAVPAVSVVIPTHGGRFVAQAIGSVIAQTMPDWELVIVDGSDDETGPVVARIAAADSRIRVVSEGRPQGAAAARNRGLRAITATSEYVAFLDHDDIWMPRTLELLIRALKALPSASASHGTAAKIDEQGQRCHGDIESVPARRMGILDGRLQTWPLERPTEFANLAVEDCVVSMGSGLMRRTALERVGPFDTRAERAEDYDMWVRLSRIGPIAFINSDVLGYRMHDGQRSRKPLRLGERGVEYIRHRMITCPENTREQHRLAIAGFRARQQQLLGQGYAELVASWRRGNLVDAPRHFVGAVACVARYARGRPWPWHR
jgi:glycosyltransferase involved in cell wall biosynthesis